MKKTVILLLIFAIICGVTKTVCAAREKNEIVRIHILASSDSEYDQNIKLKVRDNVNELLAPLLENCKTKAEAEKAINASMEEIIKIAEETSNESVSAELKEAYFPEKTYGDKVYPAGEYTALVITIGAGEGHNWWCVAFPPMCYTTSDTNKVEYRSVIAEWLERLGVL